MQQSEIPRYESISGLISVSLLQRRLAAYVELMTISTWVSDEAMKPFVEEQRLGNCPKNVIEFEGHTYELIPNPERQTAGDTQGTQDATDP
jgi:hypothetical protein